MQAGYRYRFYPTSAQEVVLRRTFGCVRYVYNRALQERRSAWRDRGLSIGFKQTNALLTAMKRDPELAWLNEPSCVPLQQCLRQLDNAYQRFFKKLARYPRFRSKHGLQSIEFTRSGFVLREGRLHLAKMEQPLDVVWSRALSSEPKTITVTCEADGLNRAGFVGSSTRCVVVPAVARNHQRVLTA